MKFLLRPLPLALIAIAVQWSISFHNILPFHDTLYYYQVFQVVYTDFFHHHEFAQWLPYSIYGMPIDWYLLNCMTIFKYPFIVIGGLSGIENAYMLFKLSIAFEELVFVLGLYYLARSIYDNDETLLIVCLWGIGSIVMMNQASLNFYSYYLLPWTLYFLRKFFVQLRLPYLFLAIIIVFLSVPGQGVYFLIVFSLELMIIFFILLIYYRHDLRKSFPLIVYRDSIVSLLLFIFLGGLAAALYQGSIVRLADYATLSMGRDPVTKTTPLDVFLSYGGHVDYLKFIDYVFPTILWTKENLDLTLYFGYFGFAFFVWAIVKARNPLLSALLTVVIVMVLFSSASLLSIVLYYIFPGMKYFRHIGLSIGSFKLFLPLIAGFAIDRLIPSWFDKRDFSLHFFLLMITVLLGGAGLYFLATLNKPQPNELAKYYLLVCILFATVVFFVRPKNISVFIVAIGLELTGYQVLTNASFSTFLDDRPSGEFCSTPVFSYRSQRADYPSDQRGQILAKLSERLGRTPFALYSFNDNFLHFDRCSNVFRADFLSAPVADLITTRGGSARNLTVRLPPGDKVFLQMIGCTVPKITLHSEVVFLDDHSETQLLVKQLNETVQPLVLNGVPQSIRRSWSNHEDNRGTISVTSFSLNTIGMIVDIANKQGAWLYYADAFHPFWQASMDDSPVPIYRANLGFKALFAPPGKHRLGFSYTGDIRTIAARTLFITAGMIAAILWVILLIFALVSPPGTKSDDIVEE